MVWNSVREETKQCHLTRLSEFVMQQVQQSFYLTLEKYVAFTTLLSFYFDLTCFIIKL